MEYFKSFSISVEQKKQVIVWLAGFYGLLLGIISMFIIELRLGIESWPHLLMILILVGSFVLVCSSIVKRMLHNYSDTIMTGSRFWFTFLSPLFILLITTVFLAIMI